MWLGKKKPERTDRVTRSSASPSSARVSYNEEILPLELLEDTSPARAMTLPCPVFLWKLWVYRRGSIACVLKQV